MTQKAFKTDFIIISLNWIYFEFRYRLISAVQSGLRTPNANCLRRLVAELFALSLTGSRKRAKVFQESNKKNLIKIILGKSLKKCLEKIFQRRARLTGSVADFFDFFKFFNFLLNVIGHNFYMNT